MARNRSDVQHRNLHAIPVHMLTHLPDMQIAMLTLLTQNAYKGTAMFWLPAKQCTCSNNTCIDRCPHALGENINISDIHSLFFLPHHHVKNEWPQLVNVLALLARKLPVSHWQNATLATLQTHNTQNKMASLSAELWQSCSLHLIDSAITYQPSRMDVQHVGDPTGTGDTAKRTHH